MVSDTCTLIGSVKNKEDLPPSNRRGYKKYEWEDDLLWYEDRVYVPDDKAIILGLLEQYHDSPMAGHQGQARTLELLARDYYWPGMKAQVNRYVETCETCQRTKGHKQPTTLKPLPTPNRPWEDIAYDMIVKLPLSGGFDSILVVVDCFSKQAHFIPCLEKTNAKEMAEIFIKEVWRLHGTPKTTISDRGRVFNNEFQKALYGKLGIKPQYSTAYHPQTDGLAEQTNQWLEGYLRAYCNYAQDDWYTWLPIAEFCHNNQINSTTGKTAFQTIYGMDPRWNITDTACDVPSVEDMTKSMEGMWDKVKAALDYHRGKEYPPKREYNTGDRVWLVTTNLRTKQPIKKLDSKKAGPFTITKKISSHAYQLDLPKTLKVHNVFHIDLLAPFTEDKDFQRRQIKPPPIITEEGEEEYIVEKILGWKEDKGVLKYHIKWEGYDDLENTWERAEKMADMTGIMKNFRKNFPEGPLPKNYIPPTRKRG